MSINRANSERVAAAIDLLDDFQDGGVVDRDEVVRALAPLKLIKRKCDEGPEYLATHKKPEVTQ